MSDNKMGGVPDRTRDALYELFREQRYGKYTDEEWAKAIHRLTALGPVRALKLLNADV